MATDRVNLVREGFEAWNAEDPRWVLEHMSPEVEWVAPERDPFPGTYKGFEGVQEFWTRWRNAVGQLKFAPEEMIDAGDHVVVDRLPLGPQRHHRPADLGQDRPGLQLQRRGQVHPRPGVLRPRHRAEGRGDGMTDYR